MHLASEPALEAELVLVAVGRGPSTGDLGLEEHGVTLDRGFVVVDSRLRTTADSLRQKARERLGAEAVETLTYDLAGNARSCGPRGS